jgi:hypothetical protein
MRGRCAVSNFFSLNCGFLPRSCCAFAHSKVLSVLGSLLSRLGEARHSSAAGQVQGGDIPPGLLWSRRTVRSPHEAVWKVEDEGLASPRLQRSYPAPGACNQRAGLASVVLANFQTSWSNVPGVLCTRSLLVHV